ncbi:unnamed protein product [Zymoseptoria tritici ST99CH_1A5]|uniref:N-acetyltransferase domain-containing protein n=1 Tax=Zymoseptoria tritici ST99CH_1A5 TaxID=1276529 RepID=A0A1Y6L9J2_ZYMTR|nr:unnamed protein product [Zymoseptoria tritici ST99CH_1A5]
MFSHGQRQQRDRPKQQHSSSRIPSRPTSSNKSNKPLPLIAALEYRSNKTVASADRFENENVSTVVSAGPTKPHAASAENVTPQRTMTSSSLYPGSSASTFERMPRNTLRRKPSGAINKYAAQKRSDSSVSRLERPSVADKLGIHRNDENHAASCTTAPLAPTILKDRHGSMDSAVDLSGRSSLRGLTPPVNGYASSGTPSTRYTDSPFSHAPTPSSTSSYSPAIGTTYSDSGWSPGKARPAPPRSVSEKSVEVRGGLPPVREASRSSRPTAAGLDPAGLKSNQPEIKVHTRTVDSSEPATRNRLRKPVSNTVAKLEVQIPPELAHLNVDVQPPVHPAPRKAQTPARPSRIGASNIVETSSASAVIHSDLPHLYRTYHKRTSSQEAPPLPASPTKARFGLSSRSSSSTRSPRIDSAVSPPPSARRFMRSRTPDTPHAGPSRVTRKDSPALLPRPSPAKSPRFGFFSRKANSDTPKVSEKPKRHPSRGPAAGTGHEAYAKLGFRGRSGSTTGTDHRSASADSVSSGRTRPWAFRKGSNASSDASDFDDFLRERLQPVFIRGNNSGSHAFEDSLEQSTPSSDRPSVGSSHCLSRSPTQPDVGLQQQSRSSSVTNLTSDARHSNAGMPPSVDPRSASRDVEPQLPQINSQRAESKWNFFQRASVKTPVSKLQKTPTQRAPATTRSQLPTRAVAHYAMVDHLDSVGLEEVVRMLQDDSSDGYFDCSDLGTPSFPGHSALQPAETSLQRNGMHASGSDSSVQSRQIHVSTIETSRQQQPSALAISMPEPINYGLPDCQPRNGRVPSGGSRSCLQEWRSAYTADAIGASLANAQNSDKQCAQQARLPSVGRIPTVVSRRDRERTLSNNSFSRPFAHAQPRPSVKPPGSVYSQIRDMASPVDVNEQQPASSSSTRSNGNFADAESSTQTILSIANRTSIEAYAQGAFLAFPPRKGSENSYQSVSSNSGNGSWLDLILPPQQDDIWDDEYNDFMDEVMPLRASTIGAKAPSQHSGVLHNILPYQQPLPAMTQPPTSQIPRLPGTNTKATVLTVPQQISRFLQPSVSPMSPDTVSAFIDGYGDLNCSTSTLHTSELINGPSSRYSWAQQRDRCSGDGSRDSVASSRRSRVSTHSRSASLPEALQISQQGSTLASSPGCSQKEARLEGIAGSIDLNIDLRFGALMTGKWLCNGRVLFSPAHHEIQTADEPRILVVDGLTSDWAQCIASSYPCAQVYNMSVQSPGAPMFAYPEQDECVPANYRQIPLSSISASFPFPKGFFTSVVFRFPTASTEESYAACVSECRRVLRPGGRLELVVLDLDLKHMGPKLRLAVRGLKTRMQQSDSGVCLQNLSDIFVRLVGEQGFESGQRYMMGVPAAGKIPRTRDVVTSSVSSDSSSNLSWGRQASDSVGKPSTFADILEGARTNILSPGSANDEKITKMMARVGRWWYAACYEKALLPSDRSIWGDPALLRECHRQDTSFRLLICHAQKPFQARRRTHEVWTLRLPRHLDPLFETSERVDEQTSHTNSSYKKQNRLIVKLKMSNIQVLKAEDADMGRIFEIAALAFARNEPVWDTMYPLHWTDEGRAQGAERMKRIKNSDPNTVYLKAVNKDTNEIMAMAKWNIWTEDTIKNSENVDKTKPNFATPEDESYATAMVSKFLEERNAAIKRTKGNLVSLDILTVDPAHQGKKVGHALVQWGLAEADRLGFEAIVESSVYGKGLYEKHGFVFQKDVQVKVDGYPDRPTGAFAWLTRPKQSA